MKTDSGLIIREAEETDAQALLDIYAPYVRDTAITFEIEVPSVSEFRKRIRHTKEMYPYLAAELSGRIAGYAYAGPFKEREAYDYAVETSIYVKKDLRESGIGRALLERLEEILRRQGILNVCACISYTAAPDPHLTNDSVGFHEHMGYRNAAHFTKCGYKFGTWYDMVWMEKMLGEHPADPKRILPATNLYETEERNVD